MIDDDEHLKNRQEMKDIFMQKAGDFTELLDAMGRPVPGED